MKAIRFKIKGVLNSFRIPFFRTYHRTFLAPPKATITGMLCNISLRSQKEFFEILEEEKIKVSVVIDKIEGRSKDLWSYKTRDRKNRGKSVVRRDRLFMPEYWVYLKIDDESMKNDILKALKNPQNIPSLGLDDELVLISDVEEIELVEETENRINSVFYDMGKTYKAYVVDVHSAIELPVSNVTATKFKAFDKKGKRISREVTQEYRQIEYINCEIAFDENVENYQDKETGNRLVFY